MLEQTITELHDDLVAFTEYIEKKYIVDIKAAGDIRAEPKIFLYTILYKLNNGLNSCQLFINNSKAAEKHFDSLFLILRTLISDSLMTLYVIKKDYTTEAEIEKNIWPLYTDHLKYGLSNLKRFGIKFWGMTEKEVSAEEQKIKKGYSKFFNVDGSFTYKSKGLSVGDVAEYLVSNDANIGNKNLVIKAQNLYSFFSKYEHLGILSFGLIHRQFEERNKPIMIRQVIEAILVIGNTIEFCLHIWKQFDVLNDETFQGYSKKFTEHRLKFDV
ncbi:MAG TPA: hypothetical protein VK668_07135 [Mucilaginibacter sp.]|nr:hypothetical protein [Mucilaginibacter sp.]